MSYYINYGIYAFHCLYDYHNRFWNNNSEKSEEKY